MAHGDIVVFKNRLYVIHSYKMDTDFIVINPLDPHEEDERDSTIFVGRVKFLGIFKKDVQGCNTLDDLRKYYPEFMI